MRSCGAAANEHLLADGTYDTDTQFEYSCHAIRHARGATEEEREAAMRFVTSLGVCEDKCGFLETDGWPMGSPETQGARYLWLDFARLVTEDDEGGASCASCPSGTRTSSSSASSNRHELLR